MDDNVRMGEDDLVSDTEILIILTESDVNSDETVKGNKISKEDERKTLKWSGEDMCLSDENPFLFSFYQHILKPHI